MTIEEQHRFINGLSPDHISMLNHDWGVWARDSQWPPAGDWRVWLIMAGRGFGKTRAGAEWIRMQATGRYPKRMALVGETFNDVRQVMVEGASGILTISPAYERPDWFPSKRLLVWRNGSVALCYSAAEPDQLRGPEHELAWCDEIAKWKKSEAWDHLMLGLRLGQHPRALATTTPQPKKWLLDLIKEDGVMLTQGKTQDNHANLSPAFIKAVETRFRQTKLAAQELDGVLIQEHPDALWTRQLIEQNRQDAPSRDDFQEIVIGVDPAVGGRDETGIVVAGKSETGLIWVLDDVSLKADPHRWAGVIVSAAEKWRAIRIVVEVNQGGALVEDVLRTKGVRWPVQSVRARQGKAARAEPVAAAYAEGLIRHGLRLNKLEDQMCNFVPGSKGRHSPDRLDAMVWAVTALMRGQRRTARMINF